MQFHARGPRDYVLPARWRKRIDRINEELEQLDSSLHCQFVAASVANDTEGEIAAMCHVDAIVESRHDLFPGPQVAGITGNFPSRSDAGWLLAWATLCHANPPAYGGAYPDRRDLFAEKIPAIEFGTRGHTRRDGVGRGHRIIEELTKRIPLSQGDHRFQQRKTIAEAARSVGLEPRRFNEQLKRLSRAGHNLQTPTDYDCWAKITQAAEPADADGA